MCWPPPACCQAKCLPSFPQSANNSGFLSSHCVSPNSCNHNWFWDSCLLIEFVWGCLSFFPPGCHRRTVCASSPHSVLLVGGSLLRRLFQFVTLETGFCVWLHVGQTKCPHLQMWFEICIWISQLCPDLILSCFFFSLRIHVLKRILSGLCSKELRFISVYKNFSD